MNRHLYIAMICFLIAVIAAMHIGCATEMRGLCRHDALYAAVVCVEKYPTRVVLGPPEHGRAQGFIDGDWKWLRRDGSTVYTGKQDDFTPEIYLTVDQYISVIKNNYKWVK